jgi:hypothetical protein
MMSIQRLFFVIGIVLFITIVKVEGANAQFTDGPIAKGQLMKEVRSMLFAEQYNNLETMAQDFRTHKTKFTDGVWKLEYYYGAFEELNERRGTGWDTFLAKLDKWQKRYPNSVTARVAAAKAQLAAAWEVRGNGFSDTVSDNAFKLIKQKVDIANNLLKEKPVGSKFDCPERYAQLLTVARVDGWNRENFDNIFYKAIKFEPTYISYYIRKAEYLLPQWHGEEGEWIKFAQAARKLVPSKDSDSIYTRIVQALYGSEDNAYIGRGISWPLMKKGYLEIDKNYPNSLWILNKFCYFAIVAGDKDTARMLFKKIGDNAYLEAWFNNRKNFDDAKKRVGM